MLTLKTFWQFCRPHTIFGSLFSVSTLFILANKGLNGHTGILLFTLLASLACNIFIVGLNQIIDVELDKINKPGLPIAAGKLSLATAKKIILISLLIAVVTGFAVSYLLGILILVICFIGYIYSVPPIQLKQHHLPAAISITLVRGLLVNIGMYIHFRYCIFAIAPFAALPGFLLPLTLFIAAFSIAIAWFKDLPDTEGDALFHYKTLSVLYSRKLALQVGSILVIAAYLFCIGWSFMHKEFFLFWGHSGLLLLFIGNLFTVTIKNPATIKNFYLRFWVLFFLEYIFFAVWAL